MNDKQIPTPGLILAIYDDGTMHRKDMNAADLRSIGQQLIAMADSVIIRGTIPQEQIEQKENE